VVDEKTDHLAKLSSSIKTPPTLRIPYSDFFLLLKNPSWTCGTRNGLP